MTKSCTCATNYCKWITQGGSETKPSWHRVYSATLSFTVFLFIVAVTACSQPPQNAAFRPIVWLEAKGAFEPRRQKQWRIDTGYPVRSSGSIHPCLFLHGRVKTSSGAFPDEYPCSCWHGQRQAKHRPSLLQQFKQRQGTAAPCQACKSKAPLQCHFWAKLWYMLTSTKVLAKKQNKRKH